MIGEKSKVTIESPSGNALTLHIEADLIRKFIQTATDKRGPWRSNNKDFQFALDSAFTAALLKFLDPTLINDKRADKNKQLATGVGNPA